MGQHYVPQEYLRAFATPANADNIWMFDKRRREWSCAAIDKVAQQREYFTAADETRLNEVESPGNRALKRLRADATFTAADRRALAVYIAVTIKRVPRRRRKALELVPAALDTTVTELRHEIRAHVRESDPRLEKLLADVDRAEANLRAKTPDSVMKQIREPWVSADMLGAIEAMVWRFVLRPAGATPFITCDNPAFYFESYGVGTAEAELTFPVSPNLALMGSHRGSPGSTLFVTVRPALSKEINRRVVSDAERFVFSPTRATWIERLATRTKPYLSRMLW